MRTTRSVFGILTIAAALLLFCGTTAKGSTETFNFNGGPIDMGADPSFSGTIPIQQFNPALGILTSIQLVFDSSYAGKVSISGPDGSIGNFDVDESTTFKDAGNNFSVTIANSWTALVSLPTFPGASGSSSPGEKIFSSSTSVILSEFTGLGTFGLEDSATQDVDLFGAPHGVTASITDGIVGASGRVTYTYTARVPDETSSVSLLTLSFGLILFARKALRKEYSVGG